MSLLTTVLKSKKIYSKDELSQIENLENSLKDRVQVSLVTKLMKIICGDNLSNKDHEVILSSHKRFDTFPINSLRMNRRGLHLARLVISNYKSSQDQKKTPTHNPLFMTEGIVTYNNFINDPLRISSIIEEIEKFPILQDKSNGENIISTVSSIPNLTWLLQESGMRQSVLDHCICNSSEEAQSLYLSNTFVQRVKNVPQLGLESSTKLRISEFRKSVETCSDEELHELSRKFSRNQEKIDIVDHQKIPHSDIFFSAVKYWYFPQEVLVEHGPLTYAKNSVTLTEQLAEHYYQASLKCSDSEKYESWRGPDHREGSFRFSRDELDAIGVRMEPITVSADTLICGNVFGVHSRGDARIENIRNAVHGSIRINTPIS